MAQKFLTISHQCFEITVFSRKYDLLLLMHMEKRMRLNSGENFINHLLMKMILISLKELELIL